MLRRTISTFFIKIMPKRMILYIKNLGRHQILFFKLGRAWAGTKFYMARPGFKKRDFAGFYNTDIYVCSIYIVLYINKDWKAFLVMYIQTFMSVAYILYCILIKIGRHFLSCTYRHLCLWHVYCILIKIGRHFLSCAYRHLCLRHVYCTVY